MAVRLAALLPRFVAVTLIWVLATATLTFAAGKTIVAPSKPKAKPAAPQRPILVVPDVRHQVYVFAEGMLDDAGFGWRVVGGAHGYAGNTVVAQTPAPGVRVIDTGAPTISLRLAQGTYPQNGTPVDASASRTEIELADAPVARPTLPAPALPKAKPRKLAKPKVRKPARRTKPRVKHALRRPPAFVVRGVRKEPLNEISLPARARLLERWVAARPQRTDRNVRHWLYQHAWIVTGARFGWWHGAEAVRTLIRTDRQLEAQWGIGSRSESVAKAALAYVEAHTR